MQSNDVWLSTVHTVQESKREKMDAQQQIFCTLSDKIHSLVASRRLQITDCYGLAEHSRDQRQAGTKSVQNLGLPTLEQRRRGLTRQRELDQS